MVKGKPTIERSLRAGIPPERVCVILITIKRAELRSVLSCDDREYVCLGELITQSC